MKFEYQSWCIYLRYLDSEDKYTTHFLYFAHLEGCLLYNTLINKVKGKFSFPSDSIKAFSNFSSVNFTPCKIYHLSIHWGCYPNETAKKHE